jgi:hypothetical protein
MCPGPRQVRPSVVAIVLPLRDRAGTAAAEDRRIARRAAGARRLGAFLARPGAQGARRGKTRKSWACRAERTTPTGPNGVSKPLPAHGTAVHTPFRRPLGDLPGSQPTPPPPHRCASAQTVAAGPAPAFVRTSLLPDPLHTLPACSRLLPAPVRGHTGSRYLITQPD